MKVTKRLKTTVSELKQSLLYDEVALIYNTVAKEPGRVGAQKIW